MTQYLVAIYRPQNYDPAVSEDEATGREIDALNDEMKAAGARQATAALRPHASASSRSAASSTQKPPMCSLVSAPQRMILFQNLLQTAQRTLFEAEVRVSQFGANLLVTG